MTHPVMKTTAEKLFDTAKANRGVIYEPNTHGRDQAVWAAYYGECQDGQIVAMISHLGPDHYHVDVAIDNDVVGMVIGSCEATYTNALTKLQEFLHDLEAQRGSPRLLN